MKKKITLTVTALALVICVAIGATLAWLVDKTDDVTNTFTYGNIDITLTETWNTDTDGDETNDAWVAKMIPRKYHFKKTRRLQLKAAARHVGCL